MLAIALLAGVCFGWWGNSYLSSPKTVDPTTTSVGKFYAQDFTPFSFNYPKRPNAIWLAAESSYDYSAAGIPTDANGLVLSSKPTVTPNLEVRLEMATSTNFILKTYIDAKYPSSAYGAIQYRTGLVPFESADHEFSGYFIKYEVDGMAGHSGEVLIFTLHKGCNSATPTDCSYVAYAIDNVADMYTESEFQKMTESVVRVP